LRGKGGDRGFQHEPDLDQIPGQLFVVSCEGKSKGVVGDALLF
jgi:hypothetical protein